MKYLVRRAFVYDGKSFSQGDVIDPSVIPNANKFKLLVNQNVLILITAPKEIKEEPRASKKLDPK